MHEARPFLDDLALVFCVAALVTLLFQRLRQPVVLGYLLAGIILGPHVPIPVFADQARIQTLSELGVVLVMFSIGLEFRLAKLVKLLPTAGVTGGIQVMSMLWLGYTLGRLFGWDWRVSLFAGAMIAISSTMIVSRVFAEREAQGHEEGELQDIVFSVLIVQDLAAILLITLLTAIASGAGLPPSEMAATAGKLVLFLGGVMGLGLLVVPRIVHEAHHRNLGETLLVAVVGICFGLALLAERSGYSVALGAFIAGSLVAESGKQGEIEHLIGPLRDIFAAVFFVSVGMLVDPVAVAEVWPVVLVFTLVVLIGQPLFISLGTFLTGESIHTSIRAGMSLAQIGEFSFIIVGLGVAFGTVPPEILGVAVAVSVLTAFTTPYLIRASGPAAIALETWLPGPLQTFVSLYTSWLEELRARRRAPRERTPVRRLTIRLMVDAVALLVIVVGASVGRPWLSRELAQDLSLPRDVATVVVLVGAVVLAAPFVLGVLRCARKLGMELARVALPDSQKKGVDLAAAPRRAFVIALQLGLVLLVGLPLIAITQPFIPLFYGAGVFLVLLAVLGVTLWHSTTNLEGHVRAGAEVVLAALRRQQATEGEGKAAAPSAAVSIREILPGLGPLTPVRLEPGSPAVGKTLAELNLRGLTGANVIAIVRGQTGVVTPTGKETLEPRDVLILSGSHAAMEAGQRELLEGHPADAEE